MLCVCCLVFMNVISVERDRIRSAPTARKTAEKRMRREASLHFSIFFCGCKQSNLSTIDGAKVDIFDGVAKRGFCFCIFYRSGRKKVCRYEVSKNILFKFAMDIAGMQARTEKVARQGMGKMESEGGRPDGAREWVA